LRPDFESSLCLQDAGMQRGRMQFNPSLLPQDAANFGCLLTPFKIRDIRRRLYFYSAGNELLLNMKQNYLHLVHVGWEFSVADASLSVQKHLLNKNKKSLSSLTNNCKGRKAKLAHAVPP
jgi:hypothetical protein